KTPRITRRIGQVRQEGGVRRVGRGGGGKSFTYLPPLPPLPPCLSRSFPLQGVKRRNPRRAECRASDGQERHDPKRGRGRGQGTSVDGRDAEEQDRKRVVEGKSVDLGG